MFANTPDLVETYLKKSLERLQLQYLDLYLIHGPFGMLADSSGEVLLLSEDGSPTLDLGTDHVAIWKVGRIILKACIPVAFWSRVVTCHYVAVLHLHLQEMERMVELGLVRSLGVSNFNGGQVKRLVSAARLPVSVNQVELHASLQQRDLVDTCRALGVHITAYSPLGSPAAQSHFINKYNYRQAKPLPPSPCSLVSGGAASLHPFS